MQTRVAVPQARFAEIDLQMFGKPAEVLSGAEAEQLASRGYQERYQEFRKQAEAVLESEPLPLGHRETVRTYFESIRPSDSDAE